MKYYILLNEDGTPKAFYTTDIHKEIPKGCLEITKEQHAELCGGSKALIDGNVVDFISEISQEEQALNRLAHLDQNLPRWAEDLVEQGAYKLYGEAKEVFEEKQKLRASLS